MPVHTCLNITTSSNSQITKYWFSLYNYKRESSNLVSDITEALNRCRSALQDIQRRVRSITKCAAMCPPSDVCTATCLLSDVEQRVRHLMYCEMFVIRRTVTCPSSSDVRHPTYSDVTMQWCVHGSHQTYRDVLTRSWLPLHSYMSFFWRAIFNFSTWSMVNMLSRRLNPDQIPKLFWNKNEFIVEYLFADPLLC